MDLHTFHLGSPVHLVTLAFCIVFPLLFTRLGVSNRGSEKNTMLRKVIVYACLISWFLTVLHNIQPAVFEWRSALPLHFCNFGNLLGALAVARRNRRAQSLLYFWGLGLSSWALITPSLTVGPATLWFWIFWLYHMCIPLSVFWVLIVDRYRPDFSDLKKTLLVTYGFTIFLAMLNLVTGWDYGFVGEGLPDQPSLLDFFGPYPIRIVWMLVVGTIIFTVLYLPWIRVHRQSQS